MLDLLNYRQRVLDIYHRVRTEGEHPETVQWFRDQRDNLFKYHSQSALDIQQREQFTNLFYYPYDPAYRVVVPVEADDEGKVYHLDLGGDGSFSMKRIGYVNFTLPTGAGRFAIFWIMGYGGGIFIPFGDATNKETTYGGGRYLYDTIKGADLGGTPDAFVLDFNYAYHPSCSYNHRWTCPLAPAENKLDIPILAGEQSLIL